LPPTAPFRVFTSTYELYDAVDEYLAAEDPETTTVAENYGYPIGTWDVSRVTDFSQVFYPYRNEGEDYPAATFNEDLSQWNVSSTTTMTAMFQDAESFNQDLSSWDISSVSDMSWMFSGANAFNQNLCSWGQRVPSSVDVANMFASSGCPMTNDPIVRRLRRVAVAEEPIPTTNSWCHDCLSNEEEGVV
jgi:surface protein